MPKLIWHKSKPKNIFGIWEFPIVYSVKSFLAAKKHMKPKLFLRK